MKSYVTFNHMTVEIDWDGDWIWVKYPDGEIEKYPGHISYANLLTIIEGIV